MKIIQLYLSQHKDNHEKQPLQFPTVKGDLFNQWKKHLKKKSSEKS